ncbi:MAG: B12-binding domain-containing radical SAM protein [Gemmatimonadales bacterium]
MKILLVQPPQGTRFGLTRIMRVEPLGLECVGAAARRRGADAELIDLRIEDWGALDRALDPETCLVGISCAFTTDVYPTLEVASYIKERRPDVSITVGGHHATLVPGDFFHAGSPVDAVVLGEGENPTADMVDAVRCGRSLDSIPGVMTDRNRRNGFVQRPFTTDFDELAPADRSLTQRYRQWYHHGHATPSASVETSRGCPFDCNFCSVWVFYQRRARRRAPASIMRELEHIDEEEVFFTDDIAFLHYDSYKELGERIVASGLQKKITCETRCDLVIKYRDIFPLWKKAGLHTVFLGVEKVDDGGLKSVRKRTKGGADSNVRAIQILRDAGITPLTSFITDPCWAEDDFNRLEDYINENALPNPAFTVLTPLPGTELYKQRKDELITHDYGYYDVIHAVLPTTLSLERFYERVAKLYDLSVKTTRLSLNLVTRATKMALGGKFWCMKRVYRAVTEMREPRAYLEPPTRVRAPS